ncbi:MAG TPA: type II CAAX endopeptidase family protein [Deltaproteobacteria bacterium]|jgi:membrane protease YdiL (CAAX protease family)|nr:type II CAAX endopeptidase family protein [Deltaproteobacteria bacterium]
MDEEGYTVTLDNGRARFTSRQEQTIEVSVFLFLIIPSMILSFFAKEEGEISFIITAWAIITRDLALMSLVLFFLWRNAESIGSIGWRWGNIWHEALIGLALFPVFFVLLGIVGALLQGIGFNVPTASQPQFLIVKGIPEMLLAFLLVVVVAVVEETIFRGYLLLRFLHITQSKTWSVLVSAVVFSLGHGYEGSAGVGTVGIMGAVFAVIYLWRGSIVAPVIIHFLQDFIGILVAPFLSGQ